MHVFVSLTARKCMCTCMCGEGGVAPPREGGNIYKRGREEMIAGIFFFPFLISNLLKIETTANSFSLNLFFSVEKRLPWPKISAATVNLD